MKGDGQEEGGVALFLLRSMFVAFSMFLFYEIPKVFLTKFSFTLRKTISCLRKWVFFYVFFNISEYSILFGSLVKVKVIFNEVKVKKEKKLDKIGYVMLGYGIFSSLLQLYDTPISQ